MNEVWVWQYTNEDDEDSIELFATKEAVKAALRDFYTYHEDDYGGTAAAFDRFLTDEEDTFCGWYSWVRKEKIKG